MNAIGTYQQIGVITNASDQHPNTTAVLFDLLHGTAGVNGYLLPLIRGAQQCLYQIGAMHVVIRKAKALTHRIAKRAGHNDLTTAVTT